MTATSEQTALESREQSQTIKWVLDPSSSHPVGTEKTVKLSVPAMVAEGVSIVVQSLSQPTDFSTDWSHWLEPYKLEPSHWRPPWHVRHAISEGQSLIATQVEESTKSPVPGSALTLVTWTKLSGLTSDIYFDEQGALHLEIQLGDTETLFMELAPDNHLTGGVLDGHAKIVSYWSDMSLDDFVRAVFDV